MKGLNKCPACGVQPFRPFLYGQVCLGGWRQLLELVHARWQNRQPCTCSLICWECQKLVGHQAADDSIRLEKMYAEPH